MDVRPITRLAAFPNACALAARNGLRRERAMLGLGPLARVSRARTGRPARGAGHAP